MCPRPPVTAGHLGLIGKGKSCAVRRLARHLCRQQQHVKAAGAASHDRSRPRRKDVTEIVIGDLLSRETTKSLRGILAYDHAAQVALEITAAGAGSHRHAHEARKATNEQIRRIGKHCSGSVDLNPTARAPRTSSAFWQSGRVLRDPYPHIAGRGISKEEFVYSIPFEAFLPSRAAPDMPGDVMRSNCDADFRWPPALDLRSGKAP